MTAVQIHFEVRKSLRIIPYGIVMGQIGRAATCFPVTVRLAELAFLISRPIEFRRSHAKAQRRQGILRIRFEQQSRDKIRNLNENVVCRTVDGSLPLAGVV